MSIAENAGKNSGSNTNMFYSYDKNNIHFVFWNSEAFWAQPVASQEAMMNWLEADLAKANANRANVPWVVSLAHKYYYMDSSLEPTAAGGAVWKLLNEGGVDLYVTGHIHQYNRLASYYPNANNGAGVADLDCITAGGITGAQVDTYTDCKYMTTIITAAPGDQEVNEQHKTYKSSAVPAIATSSNYGFSKFQAINATHLHWTFTTAVPHVNASYPDFSDELWLVVHNHGPRSNLPPA
jgi:hypothetical protein